MTVVADFIAEVQTPKTLFRHFLVVIAGGASGGPANGQAAIRRFVVTDGTKTGQGFTTGLSGLLGVTKARRKVLVTIMKGVPVGQPNANQFDAFYIPMVDTSGVALNASHYTLPTVLGPNEPDIMITSQLSGCTFGVASDANGATLVTHIRPDQTLGQGQRQTNLDTTVTNSFQGNFDSFGRPNYAHYGAVMGKLSGGRWKFYLQANRTGQGADDNIVSSLSKF